MFCVVRWKNSGYSLKICHISAHQLLWTGFVIFVLLFLAKRFIPVGTAVPNEARNHSYGDDAKFFSPNYICEPGFPKGFARSSEPAKPFRLTRPNLPRFVECVPLDASALRQNAWSGQ